MIPRYSRKVMSDLWTDDARFQLWLDVEILALERMVQLKLAPESALKNIRTKAKFSAARIFEIEKEVKHDVIAFITNIGEHIGEDSRFFHLGLTSSDLLDTAFAVQLTRATDLILEGLKNLCGAVKVQALKHKDTICIGRSHGIHAEPTTFGLKVAGWFTELTRHHAHITDARKNIAVGAISGAVGTYSNIDPSVEAHVCKSLGLQPELVSTQVIPRDRHATLFLAFAGLASSLERICVEVRHLQRTEVREAEENFTKGQKGSSAMPHKRNPILSENITGLARLIRAWAGASLENVALWHERDISHSSVERVIAPDITVTLDFMLARVQSIVENLVVYPENMRRNLDLTGGLIFSGSLLVALEKKGIPRDEAYQLVQSHALAAWDALNQAPAGTSPMSFEKRVRSDAKISSLFQDADFREIFSVERQLKHTGLIFDRVFSGKGGAA